MDGEGSVEEEGEEDEQEEGEDELAFEPGKLGQPGHNGADVGMFLRFVAGRKNKRPSG